ALIVAIMAALIVVGVRDARAPHIRGQKGGADGAFSPLRNWFCGTRHYLALLAIAFAWVGWSLGARHGGAGLRLVFGTAAVFAGARLLTIITLGSLDRALRLAPRYDAQIARYQRPARLVALLVISVLTGVVLLQVWGAEAFSWFGANSI